jgi:hypothetical protein
VEEREGKKARGRAPFAGRRDVDAARTPPKLGGCGEDGRPAWGTGGGVEETAPRWRRDCACPPPRRPAHPGHVRVLRSSLEPYSSGLRRGPPSGGPSEREIGSNLFLNDFGG